MNTYTFGWRYRSRRRGNYSIRTFSVNTFNVALRTVKLKFAFHNRCLVFLKKTGILTRRGYVKILLIQGKPYFDGPTVMSIGL